MTDHYIYPDGRYAGGYSEGAEPEDTTLILVGDNPPPLNADQVWQFPGWGPSMEAARQVEDAWRASEMAQARESRIAIAEMGDDSIPGTAKQWQDYWLALRDWKDGNPDFPDMSKRPIRPS